MAGVAGKVGFRPGEKPDLAVGGHGEGGHRLEMLRVAVDDGHHPCAGPVDLVPEALFNGGLIVGVSRHGNSCEVSQENAAGRSDVPEDNQSLGAGRATCWSTRIDQVLPLSTQTRR